MKIYVTGKSESFFTITRNLILFNLLSANLCVDCLARDDPNIPDNIERPISFAQFGETILELIFNLKEEQGLIKLFPVSKNKQK